MGCDSLIRCVKGSLPDPDLEIGLSVLAWEDNQVLENKLLYSTMLLES